MTVREIYEIIHGLAPFDTQEEWDNSGLLVGSRSGEVTCVLFALDATLPVILEAEKCGAELIVTHHPLMLSARRRLTDEDYEGRVLQRLIRSGISLIAAHTSLDRAPGGMNDTLAQTIGLQNIEGEGFIRAGDLPFPMSAAAFAEQLRLKLGDAVRLMGPEHAVVHRAGLCTGSGGGEWEEAARLGCDAFISGEIKHHLAIAMAGSGIAAFECGHFATELPGLLALAETLQTSLNPLQCKVRIIRSALGGYDFSPKP